jgi:UDP-GlcNAc:undecaprenyl-phosphate GlcNAc-1-phosphate transferase
MLQRARIMDIPNSRSAHVAPTPKSGGVAIVMTFCLGCIVIFTVAERIVIRQAYFHGFLFSALLIAIVSLYDDIKNKPFVFKLVTQFVAVGVVLASGLLVDQIALPVVGLVGLGWLSLPVSFLWIVGLTNAFNFMDGLDGLAGGVAAISGAFFCYITFSQGSTFVYITSYAIVSGALGFLVYNWHPAKVFMGDVGSAFLGFVFAVLAIIAARYDSSHTSFLVMPLLLLNFIFDTFFTFVRRLMCGERVVDAHRAHLYQLCNRLGLSHKAVCFVQYGMCVTQGLGAVWMVNIPGAERMLVFLPFLLFQAVYAFFVIRRARAMRLL